MQTKVRKKPQSNLSCSCQNTFAGETKLMPVKAVHYDDHLLLFAPVDKLHYQFRLILLKTRSH